MGKRRVLLMAMMLIWMSISLEICFCSVDNDANEKSQSRTDRVYRKLPEKSDNEKKVTPVDKAASKATPPPINSVVSGERSVPSKSKNESLNNEMVEFDPREAVETGMEYGRSRVKGVSRKTGNHNMRGETRERPIGGNRDGKRTEGVNGKYNQAQRKLQESHEFMSATEKAKIAFEAAKENISQAAGDLGDIARERSEL